MSNASFALFNDLPLAKFFLSQSKSVNGYVSPNSKAFDDEEPATYLFKLVKFFGLLNETLGCDLVETIISSLYKTFGLFTSFLI